MIANLGYNPNRSDEMSFKSFGEILSAIGFEPLSGSLSWWNVETGIKLSSKTILEYYPHRLQELLRFAHSLIELEKKSRIMVDFRNKTNLPQPTYDDMLPRWYRYNDFNQLESLRKSVDEWLSDSLQFAKAMITWKK